MYFMTTTYNQDGRHSDIRKKGGMEFLKSSRLKFYKINRIDWIDPLMIPFQNYVRWLRSPTKIVASNKYKKIWRKKFLQKPQGQTKPKLTVMFLISDQDGHKFEKRDKLRDLPMLNNKANINPSWQKWSHGELFQNYVLGQDGRQFKKRKNRGRNLKSFSFKNTNPIISIVARNDSWEVPFQNWVHWPPHLTKLAARLKYKKGGLKF